MPPTVLKQTNHKPIASKVVTQTNVDDIWGDVSSIRMLLWGGSGTGKTSFWATFPGPILVLITSGTARPGELRSINTPEYRRKITPKIVTSTAQFMKELDNAHKYETVVQDHGSAFIDIVLAELMGWDAPMAQRPIIGGNRRIWGDVSAKMKELYRAMLDASKHCVGVAQERVFNSKSDDEGDAEQTSDDDIIKPKCGAAFNPATTGWMNSTFDYVAQAFVRPKMEEVVAPVQGATEKILQRGKGVEFCLRIGIHDVFQTKYRVADAMNKKIPDVIANPTYDKFMKAIS